MVPQDKEKKSANTMRTLFGILMLFSVSFLLTSAIARYIILDPDCWKTMFFTDEVRDMLTEEIDNDLKITMIMDDDTARAVTDVLVDKICDMIGGGDVSFDDEELEEFYEEYLEDDGYISEEDFIDYMNERTGDIWDDYSDSDYRKVYETADRIVLIVLLVSAGATVLMMVLLLYVHRNKYRPLKTLCLDLIWGSVFNLMGWGFVKTLLGSAAESSRNTSGEIVLIESVDGMVTTVILICLGSLVTGIVACKLASSAIKMTDEELDSVDEEEAYIREVSDYE